MTEWLADLVAEYGITVVYESLLDTTPAGILIGSADAAGEQFEGG